jgi:hypothetical protein
VLGRRYLAPNSTIEENPRAYCVPAMMLRSDRKETMSSRSRDGHVEGVAWTKLA